MWKKLSMLVMAATIAFSFSATALPHTVDAAKKSYSGTKKSYDSNAGTTTQTPNSGVNKADPAASKTTPAAGAAKKPGFFSGGLMKGLMIGGLAGLLFGGLFGGLGMLGNILGFLVNAIAIVALVMIGIRLYTYFRDRKKFKEEPRRY